MSQGRHRDARKVELLLGMRHGAAPLDRTPTNRTQRRQAERALRRVELKLGKKGGDRG